MTVGEQIALELRRKLGDPRREGDEHGLLSTREAADAIDAAIVNERMRLIGVAITFLRECQQELTADSCSIVAASKFMAAARVTRLLVEGCRE